MIDERIMYDYDAESLTHLTKDISLIKEFTNGLEGDNKKYLTDILSLQTMRLLHLNTLKQFNLLSN